MTGQRPKDPRDTDLSAEIQAPLRRLRKASAVEIQEPSSNGEAADLVDQLNDLSLKQKPTSRFRATVAARKAIAGSK